MQSSITQCLSQAGINWEGCGSKCIWHKNGEDGGGCTGDPNMLSASRIVSVDALKGQLVLLGHVVSTTALRVLNKLSTSSPGPNITPDGGDLLDDHATLGYSRSVMDQCQASDSPVELLRISVIKGHCNESLLLMPYSDVMMMMPLLTSLAMNATISMAGYQFPPVFGRFCHHSGPWFAAWHRCLALLCQQCH